MTKSESRTGRTVSRRLAPPLVLLTLAWLALFFTSSGVRSGPSGRGMAGDFAIFLSASRVQQHGGNPYDRRAVYREERVYLAGDGASLPGKQAFIRVGNPPLVFRALQPLSGLPFRQVAGMWLAGLLVLLIAGAVVHFRASGLRSGAPLGIFLLMPQSTLAVYYGNFDAIVLASLAGALALSRRNTYLAGAVLSLTWLKPQVGLPFALLVMLFAARPTLKAAIGFCAASAGLALTTCLVCGFDSLGNWLHALTGYSNQLSVQPDIASLSGLYVYSTHGTIRTAIEFGAIAIALLVTLWARLHMAEGDTKPLASTAWLWILWFLVTPFAHYHDEVLLVIPVAALLQLDDGRHLRLALFATYCLFLSILLFPVTRFQLDLQSIGLLPVLVCCWLPTRPPLHWARPLARQAAAS